MEDDTKTRLLLLFTGLLMFVGVVGLMAMSAWVVALVIESTGVLS